MVCQEVQDVYRKLFLMDIKTGQESFSWPVSSIDEDI